MKMEIECVEFYPSENTKEITGTLKIALPKLGVGILGILAKKNKNRWFFALPGRVSTHHETKLPIRYTFFHFVNPSQQKELMAEIHRKGPPFIESWLEKQASNPAFKASKSIDQDHSITKQQKRNDEPINAVEKLAKLEFRDPPPRKQTAFLQNKLKCSHR